MTVASVAIPTSGSRAQAGAALKKTCPTSIGSERSVPGYAPTVSRHPPDESAVRREVEALVAADFDTELGEVEELSLAAVRDAPVTRLLPPVLLESPARWRRNLRAVAFEEVGSRRQLVLEPAKVGGRFESLVLVFRGRRLQRSLVRYCETDEVVTDDSTWQRLGAVSHALFRYQLEP